MSICFASANQLWPSTGPRGDSDTSEEPSAFFEHFLVAAFLSALFSWSRFAVKLWRLVPESCSIMANNAALAMTIVEEDTVQEIEEEALVRLSLCLSGVFLLNLGHPSCEPSVSLLLSLLIVDWTTKGTVTPMKTKCDFRTSLVFTPGSDELSDRFVLEQVPLVSNQSCRDDLGGFR